MLALRSHRAFTPVLLLLLVSPFVWAMDAFDLMLQEQEAVRDKAQKERAEYVYPGPERFTDKKTKDSVVALRWYAAAGDITSQVAIADLYAKGIVVPQDLKTALYWYNLAGEYGNTYAQFMMGIGAKAGWMAPPNADIANEWFRRARKQHDAVAAMRQVGTFYLDIDNVMRDIPESFMWYQLAADKGDLPALIQMAEWYFNGEHVTRDLMKAVSYYGKAAERNSDYAQYSLGLIYLNGDKLIPMDYDQALFWLRKAANQGYTAAQYSLGNMYYTGTGVPANNMLAYAWWNLARKPMNPVIEDKIALVTTKMTMDEIEQAIKLSDFLDAEKQKEEKEKLL